MNKSYRIAAPELSDPENANELFNRWKLTHAGGFNSFFSFMTTPSHDRDLFLNSCEIESRQIGHTIIPTVISQ